MIDVFVELIEHMTFAITRHPAVAELQVGARTPTRVERVERPPNAQFAHAAIAVVLVGHSTPPPRAEQLWVVVEEPEGRTINVGLPAERQEFAATHEVLVLDLEPRTVLTALAAEREARVQAPDVAHAHGHVDGLIDLVIAVRGDMRVKQVTPAAQQSLRLLDFLFRIRFGLGEEQLRSHGVFVRVDVQLVGEPVRCRVLGRVRGIEDVLDLYVHPTDSRPQCLERFGGGTVSGAVVVPPPQLAGASLFSDARAVPAPRLPAMQTASAQATKPP